MLNILYLYKILKIIINLNIYIFIILLYLICNIKKKFV